MLKMVRGCKRRCKDVKITKCITYLWCHSKPLLFSSFLETQRGFFSIQKLKREQRGGVNDVRIVIYGWTAPLRGEEHKETSSDGKKTWFDIMNLWQVPELNIRIFAAYMLSLDICLYHYSYILDTITQRQAWAFFSRLWRANRRHPQPELSRIEVYDSSGLTAVFLWHFINLHKLTDARSGLFVSADRKCWWQTGICGTRNAGPNGTRRSLLPHSCQLSENIQRKWELLSQSEWLYKP